MTADARRRRVRPQRPQVLAVQRRRLGQQGREREHRRRPHRLRARAAPRGCPRSWSSAARPGVSYNLISKIGHRLTPNAEITFDNARVPAANLIEGTQGNGDLLINRNFAWSGPVAGIAAVGVARAAYEAALDWAKTYTAGGPKPIIHYQYPGYVLGDVAAKIEACRYFCWKTAHYLDQHDYHGELIGAMCKIHCTELLFDAVLQVHAGGRRQQPSTSKHTFEKYLREATILPLYDAGNFGMQRRRVHGVIAHPDVQPARAHGRRVDRVHQGHGDDRHDPGARGRRRGRLIVASVWRSRAPPSPSGGARSLSSRPRRMNETRSGTPTRLHAQANQPLCFPTHATGHCGFSWAHAARHCCSRQERARRGSRTTRPLRTTSRRAARPPLVDASSCTRQNGWRRARLRPGNLGTVRSRKRRAGVWMVHGGGPWRGAAWVVGSLCIPERGIHGPCHGRLPSF